MTNKTLQIGTTTVGQGYPAYIVAEIGINHNGDMNLAKEMIDAAAEAGANSVKFQNYATEDFVADKSLTFTYTSQGKEVTESQYDMFKRYEIGYEHLMLLKNHCDKKNIGFHSTPTNTQGINDLIKVGTPVLKNGSDYLSHVNLVKAMGETMLPTVLSTGMATITDIEESVHAFRSTGNTSLIVLQCTSNYPTAPQNVHLSRIQTLSRTFDCLSGLSDHTQGTVAAVGSVFMGACWIEKHFTLDKNLAGPDHWFSCDPQEMKRLVEDVRTAEQMIGDASLCFSEEEAFSRNNYRLSCVAKKDLSTGHIICADDIDYQRPGTGFRPSMDYLLIGRTLKTDIKKHTPLSLDHIG